MKTALQPSAASSEDSDSVRMRIAVQTIAASLGIIIEDTPAGYKAVEEYLKNKSLTELDYLKGWASAIKSGQLLSYPLENNYLSTLTSDVYDWFVVKKGVSSTNYAVAELQNDNDLMGFTRDSKFSFTVSNGAPFTYTTVLLGRSTLTLGGAIKASELRDRFPDMFPYSGDLSNQVTFRGVEVPVGISIELTDNDGFKYVYIYYGGMTVVESNPDSIFDYSGTYTSLVSSPTDFIYRFSCDNSNYSFCPLEIGLYRSDVTQSPNAGDYNSAFYDSSGNRYSILKNENDKYVFMRTTGELYYDGKEFDTIGSAINYFFKRCGFTLPDSSGDAFIPPEVPDGNQGFSIPDPDKTKELYVDITNRDGDEIYIFLPGNQQNLKYMQEHPEVVTIDDGDDKLFPDFYNLLQDLGFELPTIDGDIWKRKFPFCLPFDLYNMFAGTSRTAVCPEFSFVVMPKDAFGLSLDNDIEFTVDFSEYDYIVKIMRFFEAAMFTVGLIIFSRKLIGEEG